jgi:hypothetical protein
MITAMQFKGILIVLAVIVLMALIMGWDGGDPNHKDHHSTGSGS